MKFVFPETIHLIGLALFILGFILAVGALAQLRGLENIDHLVTSGIFSFIRHPMYTGFILWIIGLSLYHGAFISLLIGFFGIANILYWRQLEENKLESIYGEEYLLLRNRTWF
jgi:protein-S-isoprenylcysteine O-methyltransferase Ste14